MMTDIEIAQKAEMKHIREVAAKLGISEDDLDMYGKYKAKLSDELIKKVEGNENGKLILVTAINPLRQERERQPSPLALVRPWDCLERRRLSHFVSHHLDLVSESRVVLPEADMHRWYLWRISTFTLQEIFML